MTLLSTNWLNKIHFIAQLVLHEYNIQQNQLNVQCKNIHPTDSAMGSRLGFGCQHLTVTMCFTIPGALVVKARYLRGSVAFAKFSHTCVSMLLLLFKNGSLPKQAKLKMLFEIIYEKNAYITASVKLKH